MALEPLHLGDFDLGGPLGSGATSRVFAARHRTTGRHVAVKMLEPSHRNSDELRERLHREAVMLAGVTSPHVGQILGFGYEDDQPFLVLERLRGETLADVLKRDGRVEVDPLLNWIEQLLIGVRDCHFAGVIHRDIKPANIYLVDEIDELDAAASEPSFHPEANLAMPRVVKLIDFGVARLKEIAQAGRSLTSTHHLLGSMGYMAPEQFQYAKGVGVQADLYAIGVVIFRCVSGRLPFVSRSFETLIKMKLEGSPPRLSTMPGVGPNDELDAFISTALQPNPSSRFDSARQMLEAWWRVGASMDRDSLHLKGVEVVFDDDVEVSTDVVPSGVSERIHSERLQDARLNEARLTEAKVSETVAEIENTTVNRHIKRLLEPQVRPLAFPDPSDDDTEANGAQTERSDQLSGRGSTRR